MATLDYNGCVTPTASSPASRAWHADPHLLSLACCLCSSVFYTGSNIGLRAVAHCDPYWVSCIKAVPTVLAMGAYLVYRQLQGRGLSVSRRTTWQLVGVGVFAHFCGNVAFQYALGYVGLAISVPVTLGSLLVASAFIGRFWLAEPITPRAAAAVLTLIVAIVTLSIGAGTASRAVDPADAALEAHWWWIALSVGIACFSGVAYSILGVSIRSFSAAGVPLTLMLFIITASGMIALALASLVQIGPTGILATSGYELGQMLMAGAFNAVAFLALAKALALAPVVHVNSANASQTALASVAGVLLYQEPLTAPLMIGVGLTIGGLLMLDRPRRSIDKVKLPLTPPPAPAEPVVDADVMV